MMLDKLLLNNQILANKAAVQKVRVHLVNKQVQKLRKLKKLSEKHPENKNFVSKIAKCSEILICLKKTKSTEILRQALVNEVNPHKVITNGLSSPEEVAQALFFSHNKIQLMVSQLKSTLSIDDSDTSWREQAQELSKRKRKQLRTEKKQQIRQERKVRNELERKRSEWLVENVSTAASSKVENEEVAEAQENKKAIQFGFKEEEIKESKPLQGKENKPNKREKFTLLKSKPLPPVPKSESESEESDDLTAQHTVDDFFITQTGDRYLSTVVIDRQQPELPDDGMVRKERRVMQGVSKSKFKKNFEPKPGGLQVYENKPSNASSFKGRKSNNFRKSDKPERNSVDLHPSWAAKQKQKGVKTFQGTKIVFGEEDSKPKPSQKLRTEMNGGSNSVVKEKLHPSWEAKQKLKASITDFKGKKIKFDDE